MSASPDTRVRLWFSFLIWLGLVAALLAAIETAPAGSPVPLGTSVKVAAAQPPLQPLQALRLTQPTQDKVSAELRAQLRANPTELRAQLRANPTGKVRYVVVMSAQADVSNDIVDWNAKGRYVLDTLRDVADATQPPVAALLADQKRLGNIESFKSYYIINAFGVRGNLASAEAVAALHQVARVEVFPVVTIDEPLRQIDTSLAPNAIEWNVSLVRAPQAWAMGYNGADVTIGSLDTGVRFTHQALVRQYRGNLGGGNFDHNYNWWDSIRGMPVPYDNDGHGTHTVGTILGDDGSPGPNQIGVAPGARWIATNGIGTGTTDPDIIESGQFMLAPWDLNGQNPDPNRRPVAVSNSWGYGTNVIFPACSTVTFFRGITQAWVAAGIFPSFSAGNGTYGNRPPAAYPETFETGAIGRHGQRASYTASGPSCFDAGQHPQIMAGGGDQSVFEEDLVRSSYHTGDNQYEYLAGTSMAQPATAGAIAILKQANPNLTIAQTWYILTSTAYMSPTWGLPPNNQYGYGLLQIDAALQEALELQGTPTPTVTGTPPTNTPSLTSTATIVRTATPTMLTATSTATPACIVTYNSADVPKPIPDAPVPVPITSTLTIANGPIIASIEVINVRLEHTWSEDLDVYLISPSGTRVELFTDICGETNFTQENTGFTLSDRTGVSIGEVCPPLQGTYKPEGALSAFVGQPSSGTWMLELTDDTFIDSGILHAWGLRISGNDPCGTGTVVPTSTVGTPSTSTATRTATIAPPTVTGTPPTSTATNTTRPTQTASATAGATGTTTLTPGMTTTSTALPTSTVILSTATLTNVPATGTATRTAT
ncbi:MAG: S8 family serine peptidase, partial [Chloroflexia bacterium]